MPPINAESTPPPVIGKIGPYTVFMTPPSTPKPAEPPVVLPPSPNKISPPPVQPPPPQIQKPVLSSEKSLSDGSVSGFFRNAVAKVQTGEHFTLSALRLSSLCFALRSTRFSLLFRSGFARLICFLGFLKEGKVNIVFG
ncbi:uncharacterized protein DS421_1g21450 [Arachis hypogaea]|nr:uncharacterized protein DS421_1g21450 [Arachis hypogaea]